MLTLVFVRYACFKSTFLVLVHKCVPLKLWHTIVVGMAYSKQARLWIPSTLHKILFYIASEEHNICRLMHCYCGPPLMHCSTVFSNLPFINCGTNTATSYIHGSIVSACRATNISYTKPVCHLSFKITSKLLYPTQTAYW